MQLTEQTTELAPDLDPARVLWTERFPGGAHWSYRVRRGTTLRFIAVEAGANASVLLYRADERMERLNLPDTLKAQHTAHLTAGHVLYSDMGRILASIPRDTVGWHDPLCGVSDADSIARRYGVKRYQEHRNAMHRNGKDSLLVEMGKWGLGLRDLIPNVNLFSKVAVDTDGRFRFAENHAQPGDFVELRFEMDTLVLVSTAPHPLDPRPDYAPGKVAIVAWDSGPAGADDPCRLSCPENGRGYTNTEMIYR
ncbi:urea carboxylase-associated family protein [Massilia sp. TW-1]|uniref:Urea carboxylase-associated family protein n=1 Tax=Telluria antibiotica TaxID=2717319 RepID=A0ABX0P9W0_9BURK|nr:urea amidolyase associated protein UAAP1 [Telluria antibiotica]NIA53418.1 urea carboxylase-associated family protein [Telluria antibiotica]